MKVLLVGGGGREHALGWKLAQSPRLAKLYLAPGSPGLKPLGETIGVDPADLDALADEAARLAVDLVVVGPEAPLAAGLSDRLAARGVPCFGPSAAAARIEASKAFMKEVCDAAGAPTAAWTRSRDPRSAKEFLRRLSPPYVVKADGLAAGKGVVIADTLAEADRTVDEFLGGRFGAASAEIVIEEFMTGEEASFFALCDGARAVAMIAAQDHKRVFDGDLGPNTGGMGAYSPAPVFTSAIAETTMRRIIEPVIAELARRGAPYTGVLFAGLMIGADGPKVVEFNARFGDPECQVLMRRLSSDLLPALTAAAAGDARSARFAWSEEAATLVVLAAKGYPGAYETGSRIEGLARAERIPGVVVFHAGTDDSTGALRAKGGRVLNVTATGRTIAEATARAYEGVAEIDWPQGFYRHDIARRALKRAP